MRTHGQHWRARLKRITRTDVTRDPGRHSKRVEVPSERNLVLKICAGLLLTASLFAGTSIQLSNTYVSNASFPARRIGLPWRVEFYLHDWADRPTNNSLVADAPALGMNAQLLSGTGAFLQLYNTRETGGSGSVSLQSAICPTRRFMSGFSTIRITSLTTVRCGTAQGIECSVRC